MQGGGIILDSLNSHLFYLVVNSWIPIFKLNFLLLQAGPALHVTGWPGSGQDKVNFCSSQGTQRLF